MATNTPNEDAASLIFPNPLVYPPIIKHQQTFIILHGRGSVAPEFGPHLLAMVASGGGTLLSTFPHAKFIFPTAAVSRATIYKRAYTHQWFNNWHLEEYTKRQDLQIDGLRASCAYIHELLRREIEIVGGENVVLWGLSQGCATSLTALLTWDGKPFAATVGMCGWLPFSNLIEEIVRENESGDDPFSHSGDDDEDTKDPLRLGSENSEIDTRKQAVAFLREHLDMNSEGDVFWDVPVFLGHGTEDEKVSVNLGREAKSCLDLVGVDVQMIEYEGLGHWYSQDMLRDIFQFLKKSLKIDKEIS
ncbi:hypothetical protein EG329_003229 [Mollisiaceae sp. DMI_Dod_QoI]|nr:hypothetical protein EG329_003229 [Helotiales sp. DMI_Dod_QoI]